MPPTALRPTATPVVSPPARAGRRALEPFLRPALLAVLALGAGCGGGSGGGGGGGAPNAAPAVGAGASAPLLALTPFTLQGAATDPEGDPLSFAWTLVSAPAGAAPAILAPTAASTGVAGTLPAGAYAFSFAASDGTSTTLVNVPVTLEDPAPTLLGTLFEHDRHSLPLAGTVPVTSGPGGAPVYLPRLSATGYEGGWSGLARARDALGGHVNDEVWVINDRGPNFGIRDRVPAAPPGATAFGAGAKVFPLPGYQQKIQRLRIHRPTGTVQVLSSTGLRDRSGLPTHGLPSNVVGMTTTENAWSDPDDKGATLAKSPQGFDFEGLVEDLTTIAGVARRVFWTCDEYGPSVQMIEADPASPDFGRILREYIPGATPAPGAGLFALPAVLRGRRDNRGFEGVAVTRAAVWALVQSNLSPAATGNGNARAHRLVRIDKASGAVTMYAYDHVADPAALGSSHGAVKVGDLVAISECEFLVLEHDGLAFAHVYRVRVTPTTTELAEATGTAYEAGTQAYVPVEKTLVADLTELLAAFGVPDKPEGLVLTDPSTLLLAFDDDYGFTSNEVELFAKDGLSSRNLLLQVKLPAPVVPSLRFVAEFPTGLTGSNAEIVDVEPGSGRAFVTCDQDQSVFVFDASDPAAPHFLRRDAMPAGSATSVAVHPAFGYYLVAVREGGAALADVLEVRSTATGGLLRTLDLGPYRGPDAVRISPNGRFALVCNEAEAAWHPGSIGVFDLGAGPYADAVAAAAGIGSGIELPLTGLVPATGAFSTRWVDKPVNAPPPGTTVTTANGVVTIVDGDTRATDPLGQLATDTLVTFTFGATSVQARFKWDGAVSGGNDGNVFVFLLDGSSNALEPEIAAFAADSSLAVVTLQENNAVVVVDLATSPPALRAANGVLGLGLVNVPDQDVKRNDPTATSPAKFVQPLAVEREADGVALATLAGTPCFVTADEGDTYGPDYTTASDLRQRGGRTLSVFRLSDGALLGDTGNALDFACNAAGRWGAFLESSRARRGGCEPENLDVTSFGDRVLAVVGLERANAVALVDLTHPAYPSVIDLAGIGGLSAATARTAPEGIKIRTVGGRTYAFVAFELSGTVGLFEIR